MKLFGKEWFSVGPDEAAIILGKVRVDFHWPMPEANPKQELVDTLAFLQHAIARKDWWEEWAAHEQALHDIAIGPNAPVFQVIEGGKTGEIPVPGESGPFAPPDMENTKK